MRIFSRGCLFRPSTGFVMAHAAAGRLTEAEKLMTRLCELDPRLRVWDLKDLLPLQRPEDFAKWRQARAKRDCLSSAAAPGAHAEGDCLTRVSVMIGALPVTRIYHPRLRPVPSAATCSLAHLQPCGSDAQLGAPASFPRI